jgi:hypothetical protein
MNAAPMIGSKTAIRSPWCPPTLRIATASTLTHTTVPPTAMPASARLRLGERADRGGGF